MGPLQANSAPRLNVHNRVSPRNLGRALGNERSRLSSRLPCSLAGVLAVGLLDLLFLVAAEVELLHPDVLEEHAEPGRLAARIRARLNVQFLHRLEIARHVELEGVA